MSRRPTIALLTLGMLLARPALAQAPADGRDEGSASRATVPMGSLQRVQNAWRAGALVGTPVFNDAGQRIGAISDLLVTDAGAVGKVVLSVAQSRKFVAVPFDQLRFVPSASLGTPLGPRGRRLSSLTSVQRIDVGPYGVMLPGVSREALAGMESFRRAPSL